MGYGVAFRMYHTPVVRVQLTQSIKTHIPAMLDEISRSFEDMIGSPEGIITNFKSLNTWLDVNGNVPIQNGQRLPYTRPLL